MKLGIFILILALYFYEIRPSFAQSADNSIVIELSATTFTIERPFTIAILVRDSEERPTVTFPTIPGLVKQGTSNSSTRSEISGREVVSQIVTQTYAATQPGIFRLPAFAVTINGQTIRSPGAQLIVKPSAGSPATSSINSATASAKGNKRAAFLQTTVNRTRLYTGEGLHIRTAFYVAENYPYELRFDQLAQQVDALARQLRPVNAWEENDNISELRPRPALQNGQRYIEYPVYSATFFPLAMRNGLPRTIALPAVSLLVSRLNPATPQSATPASQSNRAVTTSGQPADRVAFTSEPIQVLVQPLPPRSGQAGAVSVGSFRLVDEVDRSRVAVGQSVRYDVRLEGQGNIASIQAPQLIAPEADLDVFPPQSQEQIGRSGDVVSGFKSFRYFLIPKQKGTLTLANRFFWVYFDPQTGRYDTLRPRAVLRVGEAADSAATGIVPSDTLEQAGRLSIYAGLEQTDSTRQSVNWPVLVRAIANVLIILMILGTLFVFARK